MTEYQCCMCKVVTTVDDEDKWFGILTKHHLAHVGTKWGPGYEGRRFIIFHPPCARSGCKNEGTHTVRNEFWGYSYCDEHWKERDLDTERRLLME